MNRILVLNIKHNRKIKKFQWRNKFDANDFYALIASVFHIKEKIVGIKNKDSLFLFFYS